MSDRDQGTPQKPENQEPAEPQTERVIPDPHPSRNRPLHPDEFTEGEKPSDLWKDS